MKVKFYLDEKEKEYEVDDVKEFVKQKWDELEKEEDRQLVPVVYMVDDITYLTFVDGNEYLTEHTDLPKINNEINLKLRYIDESYDYQIDEVVERDEHAITYRIDEFIGLVVDFLQGRQYSISVSGDFKNETLYVEVIPLLDVVKNALRG